VSRTLEPAAPAARKRLAAVKTLVEAGACHASSAIAPVVPQVTDHELEAIVAAATEAGAVGVFYLPVRLPHEVAPLFRAWLDEHYAERAAKVMHTIQSMRGGKDNDPKLVQPHARERALCRPAPRPLRSGGEEERLRPAAAAAAHRPVRAALRAAAAAAVTITLLRHASESWHLPFFDWQPK
jgi:DNA repair photolyase